MSHREPADVPSGQSALAKTEPLSYPIRLLVRLRAFEALRNLGLPTPQANAEGLRIRVTFVVPPVHESVVIEATALDPSIDRRNAAVYEDTLFARDETRGRAVAGEFEVEAVDAGFDASRQSAASILPGPFLRVITLTT